MPLLQMLRKGSVKVVNLCEYSQISETTHASSYVFNLCAKVKEMCEGRWNDVGREMELLVRLRLFWKNC